MSGYFIGVDVGTGSARAGVFDAVGQMLGSAKQDIKTWREAGDIVEQSSEDIWSAVSTSVRRALEAAAIDASQVAGIGFDATCSLVVLGADGRSLPVGPSGDPSRNIIVWMDHRATEQAERINRTGSPPFSTTWAESFRPRWKRPSCFGSPSTCPPHFARPGNFST